MGLVISGITQSQAGAFATENAKENPGDFIAAIDEKLEIKWVFHPNQIEYLHLQYNQLHFENDYLYTLMTRNSEKNEPSTSVLLQLDQDGQEILKKEMTMTGLWGSALAVLNNGDIVVGYGSQGQLYNEGGLVILDQKGNEKKVLPDLLYAPQSIVPQEDNGFIVTSNRIIATAPQPAFVSSIWFDTELFVIKFNKHYKVEWQKTYDAYPNVMRQDYIKIFEAGKLLVEKDSLTFSFDSKGNYIGFSNMPTEYIPEQAEKDGYFVKRYEEENINNAIWDQFVETAREGHNTGIRMVTFASEKPHRVYFSDLYFNDGYYYLFDSSADHNEKQPFLYLLTLEGKFGNPPRDSGIVILTDDNTLTFNEVNKSMYSSNMEYIQSISPYRLVRFE